MRATCYGLRSLHSMIAARIILYQPFEAASGWTFSLKSRFASRIDLRNMDQVLTVFPQCETSGAQEGTASPGAAQQTFRCRRP